MNEEEYHKTYNVVNNQRCIFEKMVLLRYGSCEHCEKLFLAEREAMACQSAPAQKNCLSLLNTMRKNARFVLQMSSADSPLPHTKEIKVQAGGLYALQQYLENKETAQIENLIDDKTKFNDNHSQPIKNIFATVSKAVEQFKAIKNFPYDEIVKAINLFTLPTRKSKRKKRSNHSNNE